ncbi:MAG: glycosyltransferase family 4 protein [Planctomycetes bacterium]|nr:glycosyltransferase family 4 protein [Planctomycetota bacterium]
MTMPVTVVQYWAGYPKSTNSKWQRFLAIVRQCRERGWRNYIVWTKMSENPSVVEPFREACSEIILQPRSRRSFDLACVWRTYKLLRGLKCDIFHCYNDHTSPLIGAALARIPVRIWSKLAMSSYYEKNINPKGLHRLALSSRLSCALSTRVLARSRAVRDELIASGATPSKIMITPVDVDITRYSNTSVSDLRSEMGYSKSNLIITTIGHAVPVKGWDILLSSFEDIARQKPEAKLLFVGSISSSHEITFAQSLQDQVKHNGLSDRVCFLGHRDDIASILTISDVFVLPSRSEGQPGALVEAMASGLPCLGTRAGGVPEVITDGHDGLLVDRENIGAMTHAISRLLENKNLRKSLGRNAKETAKHFDLTESTKNLIGVYLNLLSK